MATSTRTNSRTTPGVGERRDLSGIEEVAAWYMDTWARVTDTYALQQPDGSYKRLFVSGREPLPLQVAQIERHLHGDISLGLYMHRVEDNRVWGAWLDHDDKIVYDARSAAARSVPEDGIGMILDAQYRLERQGVPSLVVASGRGAHLHVLFTEPLTPAEARAVVLLGVGEEGILLHAQGHQRFEIFPKSDGRGDGGKTGSLMRAELGVHRKYGSRFPLLGPDRLPLADTLRGLVAHAHDLGRVDGARVLAERPWLRDAERHIAALGRSTPRRVEEPIRATENRPVARSSRAGPLAPGMSPIERWKDEHSIAEVMGRYGVAVERSGNYNCPLPHHANGDRRPSLSIDVDKGVWYCHTAGDGGDAFAFVQRAEGFPDARETLAYMRGRGEIADPMPDRIPAMGPTR